jgi:predicted DNA-binding protein with PD1-like motif
MNMERVREVAGRRGFLKAMALGAAACAADNEMGIDQAVGGERRMRTIVSEGLGRVVILSFDRGEKLREGIRDKLKELGIRNAVVISAIGTFEKARFHRIITTDQRPKDEIFEIAGPMELAAVDGIVADGEPHLHMAFQDLDRAYAAHLEDGSVICYLAEIVLAEIKGVRLARVRNEYGIPLLQRKE